MPKMFVLPHPDCAPNGAELDVAPGKSICDALLDNNIDIEHPAAKLGRVRPAT